MRKQRFTFLCNQHERKLIRAIAEQLNRSQGDAMRFLVKAAATELSIANDGTSRINANAEETTSTQLTPHQCERR